jgi:aspartate aminotransferase-like enzyme
MSGRPFLQIPGPTLVPERVTRAMSQSIIDHRGPKGAVPGQRTRHALSDHAALLIDLDAQDRWPPLQHRRGA